MAIPYVHVVGYDCASLEQKVPCIDLTCRLHGEIKEVQYFINQQCLVWLYILLISAIIISLFNKSPLLFVSKIGPDGSIPMIAENAKCVSISLGKQFICRFIQIIQIYKQYFRLFFLSVNTFVIIIIWTSWVPNFIYSHVIEAITVQDRWVMVWIV